MKKATELSKPAKTSQNWMLISKAFWGEWPTRTLCFSTLKNRIESNASCQVSNPQTELTYCIHCHPSNEEGDRIGQTRKNISELNVDKQSLLRWMAYTYTLFFNIEESNRHVCRIHCPSRGIQSLLDWLQGGRTEVASTQSSLFEIVCKNSLLWKTCQRKVLRTYKSFLSFVSII